MIEPVYQTERVTVYHGDALTIMPQLERGSVDAIVTDPPYGISVIQKTYQNKKTRPGKSLAHKRNYPIEDRWDNQPPIKDAFVMMSRFGVDEIIWGGNYFAKWLGNSPCWLVWDKKNGKNDFADCELAWTSFKGAARLLSWRWSGMLQENMDEKDIRIHPTQKPVAVMRWCLTFLPEGCTVLDPFAGSSTLGIATIREGMRCILIEREEKYIEASIKRLEAEEAQGRLF